MEQVSKSMNTIEASKLQDVSNSGFEEEIFNKFVRDYSIQKLSSNNQMIDISDDQQKS